MTYKAAGASNPNIKNVLYIDYLRNSVIGEVTAIVNKHQMVGRYTTLANAQEAVSGILVKLGCKNLNQRLATIPTKFTELVTPTADVAPNTAVTWNNITHTKQVELLGGATTRSYTATTIQLSGFSIDVVMSITLTSNAVRLFCKKQMTSITTNSTLSPEEDGFFEVFSGSQLVVTPNEFVSFKCKALNENTTSIGVGVTIRNVTNSNAVYDTFSINYSYIEI